MKKRIFVITAALAVIFMLPISGMTAYALSDDSQEQPVVAENLPEDEEYTTPTTGEPVPFTPPGTGTVVDYATDADGKVFYTIITPDEHVFYLVIDRQRGSENVYFLNAVTIADLAALAELPPPPQETVIAPPPADVPEVTEEIPTLPETEEQQQGNSIGMYIFIVVLAVLGGGAGWYFKIYRPKQNAASADEYDPSMDDDTENDYADEYADEYADGWGEDTDEAEDAESGDE